jgi:hypothetical protein
MTTQAKDTIAPQHRDTACELEALLEAATLNGTLDELAAFVHPDVINRFCDAVADMADRS